MPDDFDYSQPVARNRAAKGSTPFITMALIALCVVFTAAYFIAPQDDKSNALYKVVHLLLRDPDQIWHGSYLGLFTSFFIHLDIMHILFNMLWIWRMGSTLEQTIAPWKYILFLVTATMVGSCCELLISGQTGAGASGAGYALMGLLWAGRGFHDSWRRLATRETLNLFLIWGVFCIFLTITKIMPVGNGAHFGGLLFGFAIGHLFFAPRRKPVWAAALVFLFGVCVVSLTWLPWNSSWNWYKGSQAYNRLRYKDAISYYEAGLRTSNERGSLLHNIALCWANIANEERMHNHMDAAAAADAKFDEVTAEAERVSPPSQSSEVPSEGSTGSSPEGSPMQSGQDLSPSKSKKGK